MKVKPWQIGVIVIGLLGGVGLIVWWIATAGPVRLAHSYTLIDVTTGEIYEVDSTRYHLILPARRPDTGKIALVGVSKDEEGNWFVSPRDRGSIKELDPDVEVKAVDAQTGEVLIKSGAVKPYRK